MLIFECWLDRVSFCDHWIGDNSSCILLFQLGCQNDITKFWLLLNLIIWALLLSFLEGSSWSQRSFGHIQSRSWVRRRFIRSICDFHGLKCMIKFFFWYYAGETLFSRLSFSVYHIDVRLGSNVSMYPLICRQVMSLLWSFCRRMLALLLLGS